MRLSSEAHGALKELAADAGLAMVRFLDDLVRDAYDQRIWARVAEANRKLQADPAARDALEAEEVLWSSADRDNLDSAEGIDWDDALEDAASW